MSQIGQLIEGHPLIRAEKSHTVRDAAKLMAKANVGAVAVLESGRLVGVFSERDIMTRVVADGLDPEKTSVGNT